jgi:hypothetical protein
MRFIGIFIAIIMVASNSASAADFGTVPGKGVVEIDAHGLCQRLRNGNEAPLMVPLGTAQEWREGPFSHLSNVPPNTEAVDCNRPIVLRRIWNRTGPPGREGHPIIIEGDAEDLEFLSVASPAGRGMASVVNGDLVYDPGLAFSYMNKYAVEEVVILFTARDSEGIVVPGRLAIDVVGEIENNWLDALVITNPRFDQNGVKSIPVGSDTNESPEFLILTGNTSQSFDGKFSSHGIAVSNWNPAHILMIDLSVDTDLPATMGWSPGDVNLDGKANRVVDLQIAAALDLIDALSAEVSHGLGSSDIIMDNGKVFSVSRRAVEGYSRDVLYLYAFDRDAGYFGTYYLNSPQSIEAARQRLIGLRSYPPKANLSASLTRVSDGGNLGWILTQHPAAVIHVVTPGLSSADFSAVKAAISGTGEGQLGVPIKVYASSTSHMASANALDHQGAATPLSSRSAMRDRTNDYPVRFAGVNLSLSPNKDTQNWITDQNGDGLLIPVHEMPPPAAARTYGYVARLTPEEVFTCRTQGCSTSTIPMTDITSNNGKAPYFSAGMRVLGEAAIFKPRR